MASLQKTVLAVIVKSLLRGKSLIQAILSFWMSPLLFDEFNKGRMASTAVANIQDFLKEAETEFLGPVSGSGLARLSAGLKKEMLDRLQTDAQCMLPSYSHQLPRGSEAGKFVALDVGGSTLRVALVELMGRDENGNNESKILNMRNFSAGKDVKDLVGTEFFDWLAARIYDTLSAQGEHNSDKTLPMALAWSFPIE